MNQAVVYFLDLPNEMLLKILKQLDNINVLYSCMGTFNERFDTLLQDNVFTNTLNFIRRSSTDTAISSLPGSVLDRFCLEILPKINHNVKHLILNTVSMECILLAVNYPNLISLKLFHLGEKITLDYYTSKYFKCNCSMKG
jgi:hypothetical protein